MKRLNTVGNSFFWLGLVAGVLGLPSTVRGDFVFGTPTNLGATVNTAAGEVAPSLSADGLSLYFTSEDGYGGQGDIWIATRPTTNSEWGQSANLGPAVNSTACETSPCISADGLTLFFCDGHWGVAAPQRPGGCGDVVLWVTTRRTVTEPWESPVNLGPQINSPYWDGDPALSADGRSLYFAGDTNVFSDMQLIEQLYHPELVFLPIGDLFTMGPREAALAARLLKAERIIPMHFGTFPALTGCPDGLRQELGDFPADVWDLKPGVTVEW
jgi:hypothetical protein